MDWLQKITSAIAYIEDNLDGEIDMEEAARRACCSSYNFQRMFSFIADVPLAEYIRRRRMSLAAFDLRGGAKVIDTAVKYGYDSPSAFARAFQAVHGIVPSAAKESGAALKAYPRISFQITIKGDKPMQYRIEEKPAFRIFGLEGVFKNDYSGASPRNPGEFWDQCQKDGDNSPYTALFNNAGTPPAFVSPDLCKIHGACGYRNTGKGTFPYMLFAFEGEGSKIKGYTAVNIPACTWAVFTSEPFSWDAIGQNIDLLYKRFYSEWLPASGYAFMEGTCDTLEIYGGLPGSGNCAYIELWFPIQKK